MGTGARKILHDDDGKRRCNDDCKEPRRRVGRVAVTQATVCSHWTRLGRVFGAAL